MCGILAVLELTQEPAKVRKDALMMVKKLRHRGPDWSGVYADEHAVLCHERLAIVDVMSGAQPLVNRRTGAVLAVNGEIYNHKEIADRFLKRKHEFQTESDCEVLLYLYEEYGVEFLDKLNGMFGFVLYDKKNNDFLIARDHMGIIPLYMGRDEHGMLYVSSELKAISDVCKVVDEFPPGHYLLGSENKLMRYYNPSWNSSTDLPAAKYDPKQLSEALDGAVRRQLMCDVPYGVLISGGVDSSIVAALVARQNKIGLRLPVVSPHGGHNCIVFRWD